MSDTSKPFWIPSLNFIPESLPPFKRTTIDPNTNIEEEININDDWFVYTNDIDIDFVNRFLKSISPAMTTLLFAGYQVTKLEILIEDIDLEYDGPDTGQPEIHYHWLHLDLKERQVKINNAGDLEYEYGETGCIVKFFVIPNTTAIPLKFPTNISIGEEVMDGTDNFFQKFEETGNVPEYYQSLQRPAFDVLEEQYAENIYSNLYYGPDEGSLLDYRHNLMLSFLENLPDSEEISTHAGQEIELEVATFLESYGHPDLLFKAIKELLFDTIVWYGSHITAKEWNNFFIDENETYTFNEAAKLPGFLWILNPYYWNILWEEEFERADGLMQSNNSDANISFPAIAQKLYNLLSDFQENFDEQTSEDPSDTISVIGKENKVKFTLIENLVAFYDEEIHVSGSIRQFILSQIANGTAKSKGLKKQAQQVDTFQELYAYFKTNAGTAPNSAKNDARQYARQFYKDDLKDLLWFNTLVPDQAESRKVARKCRWRPYIETIMHMTNLGALSMEGLQVDVESYEDEFEQAGEDVEYFFANDNQSELELYLNGQTHLPLRIIHQKAYNNYPIYESCAWEYIPSTDVQIPFDLEDQARALGIDPNGRYGARLIIVAAPGIAIDVGGWPQNDCIVEIYRVQSHSQVPEWGEKIHPQLFMDKSVKTPMDHFQTESPYYDPAHDENADQTDVSLKKKDFRKWTQDVLEAWQGEDSIFYQYPEPTHTELEEVSAVGGAARTAHKPDPSIGEDETMIPYVTVEPFRENGNCGVKIKYISAKKAYWRGIPGDAEVKITHSETDGTARYAYDLFPYPEKTRRVIKLTEKVVPGGGALGKSEITTYYIPEFDIIRYRLIIYRTENVDISIKDPGIGVLDAFASFFHPEDEDIKNDDVFKYHVYKGTFNDIPPQGTTLEYDKSSVTEITHSWVKSLSSDGNIAYGEGTLQYDRSQIDKVYSQIYFDSATFIIDLAVGMTFIGDAVDLSEFLLSFATGTDKWGRPITNLDRAILLGGVLIPFVSGATLRSMKNGTRFVDEVKPSWMTNVSDVDHFSPISAREVVNP